MKNTKKQHYNKFLDGRNKKANIQTPVQSTIDNRCNFLVARLKAFITDMFLINMPLLYTVVYIIMGSKESFQHNHIVTGLCEVGYCVILFLFFYFKGQTPGFRYAEIMLCSTIMTHKQKHITDKAILHDEIPPKAWQIIVYICVWLIEVCFFLWVFAFFRKDKRTLHEIISHTKIIYKANPAKERHANITKR